MAEPLLIAKAKEEIGLLPGARQSPRPHRRRDRHRQDRDAAALAEDFSRIGVPVFMADVKGDLSGLAPGGRSQGRRSRNASSSSASTLPCARPARSRSGTCSASRAIRCARRSRTWGRCCFGRLLDLNDTQAGRAHAGLQDRRRQRPAAARPQGSARDAAVRRRERQAVQDRVRQRLGGIDRRDPARPARRWSSRAPRSSSASRRSTSTT